MKLRNGFVSNSSSSSFTMLEVCFTCGTELTMSNKSITDHCCKDCFKIFRKKKLEMINLSQKINEINEK